MRVLFLFLCLYSYGCPFKVDSVLNELNTIENLTLLVERMHLVVAGGYLCSVCQARIQALSTEH